VNQLTLLPLPDVRDQDLLDKVNAAQGTFGHEFILKRAIDEQKRRDALAALPRDQRRRAITRQLFEEKANTDRDNLRHIHSVLAGCSLPYTQQPLAVREWERRQGRMSLVVTAGKLMNPEDQSWVEQPLPWGSRARLLLLHTCSEAIRQKSATIDIEDSLSGFIRSMGFKVNGGKRGVLHSFKQQVNALAACSMRLGMWDGTKAKTINTQPFSSIDIWLPASPDQRMMWPETITFSHEFYSTLIKHALPINVHAVKTFGNSPRKLDLLFWLGYRLKGIKSTMTISWDALQEQWGANYSRQTNFKRDFAQELQDIKEVFPKLPVKLTDAGFVMEPGGTEVLAIPAKR
jgi:hypothetical protein